eukprot:14954116-Ditylum_brightwellii.AAC.1
MYQRIGQAPVSPETTRSNSDGRYKPPITITTAKQADQQSTTFLEDNNPHRHMQQIRDTHRTLGINRKHNSLDCTVLASSKPPTRFRLDTM